MSHFKCVTIAGIPLKYLKCQRLKLLITHHVKKLRDKIDISGNDDATVNTVIEGLLSNFKEYQSEPRDKLQITVKDVIKSILDSESLLNKAPQVVVVASLNQMMQNQYNKAASKRQRPVDFDNQTNENKDIIDPSTLLAVESTTDLDLTKPAQKVGIEERTISGSSSSKKKKPSSSSRSEQGSAVLNPLLLQVKQHNYKDILPFYVNF